MRWLSMVVLMLGLAPSVAAKEPARHQDAAARLVGSWSIDPTDEAGLRTFGRCTMEFQPNGQLIYTVPEGKMLLTYRVEGDVLVTDQPSHPRVERTRFVFAPDGSLVLEKAGQRGRFRRQSAPAR